MNGPVTLLSMLEDSGTGVLIYDIGRRIGALTRATFAAFEAADTPYPLPMQRKAWLALVQTGDRESDEPVIWFLQLSLDEQGLLIPAERDYLLSRLLESAQARQRGDDPQAFLRDNPHAFSPREDRMALFHARLSADLGRPPSRFYTHALDYFRGAPGWDQWGFVGYQGIADVACRHPGEPLDRAIAHLPREPLVALCHCLESQATGGALETALLERLDAALRDRQTDVGVIAALVRGLAGGVGHGPVRKALGTLLESPAGHSIEVLAAVSGRAWETLADRPMLDRYLRRLATNDHGQSAFEHCVSDLLSLPSLATDVRSALRSQQQAGEVREAFAIMTGEHDATPR